MTPLSLPGFRPAVKAGRTPWSWAWSATGAVSVEAARAAGSAARQAGPQLFIGRRQPPQQPGQGDAVAGDERVLHGADEPCLLAGDAGGFALADEREAG